MKVERKNDDDSAGESHNHGLGAQDWRRHWFGCNNYWLKRGRKRKWGEEISLMDEWDNWRRRRFIVVTVIIF